MSFSTTTALNDKYGRIATTLASIGTARVPESNRKSDELDERLETLSELIDSLAEKQNKEFFAVRDNFQKIETAFREDRTRRESKMAQDIAKLEGLERLLESKVQEEQAVSSFDEEDSSK